MITPGIFGSTVEATKRFGPSRVFDAPAMENGLIGILTGAAAMGKRPVSVHPRVDFMFSRLTCHCSWQRNGTTCMEETVELLLLSFEP